MKIDDFTHEHGDRNHHLALGLLAGTAVGVGLGMLVAPRPGAELRKQVVDQAGQLADATSKGYHRVADTAGDLAHRSAHAYESARDYVTRGAHEAQRYVRDVTDAVTQKGRKEESGMRERVGI